MGHTEDKDLPGDPAVTSKLNSACSLVRFLMWAQDEAIREPDDADVAEMLGLALQDLAIRYNIDLETVAPGLYVDTRRGTMNF